MDLRIETIFQEQTEGDTSFREPQYGWRLLFPQQITLSDMRKTWNRGIKHGIEIGLRVTSLEGAKIELYRNTTNDKDREFLDKFHELAHKYNCAIQYHPQTGMTVVALDRK